MFEIYHDIFAVVTECTGLMYGQNCNLSCGHCIMSEQCHHINGTCMSGCDIGYHGLHCTEGKTSGQYFKYGCFLLILKVNTYIFKLSKFAV